MIFQNPRAALNPIRTVGRQIADVLAAHDGSCGRSAGGARPGARAAARRCASAIRRRGSIAYPHELSGGMCQRVMIAMAIACEPALLIADEPTTGLDVTTQKTVMDLLAGITAERGMAMILITHDLGLAARYCDRIAVMERGEWSSRARPRALFAAPQHPYTRRLVAASPTRDLGARRPRARMTRGGRACRRRVRAATGRARRRCSRCRSCREVVRRADAAPSTTCRSGSRPARALGLVGESGSGKSTLSRLVCRLLDPDDGDIVFDGEAIGRMPAREFHRSPLRRDIQIVFQDPNDSLNPRFTAFDCIAHPLRRSKACATARR